MALIPISKMANDLQLEVIYDGGKEFVDISTADVSRPGLQLAGFFDYFAFNRTQIFGNVENSFVNKLTPEDKEIAFDKLFSYEIPFALLSVSVSPQPEMVDKAKKYGRIIMKSNLVTSKLENQVANYLNTELAPMITEHAVAIDVYGVGILLMGDSGIGKSETALELIKRGHRLVADDAVIIKKIADNRLTGQAPEIIRHLMEIRGIGIINIEHMYGVSAVINSKSVDIVMYLELWDEGKHYDRLGTSEEFTEILGVRVPKIIVPVRPGRNLAIIIEVAARNFRLKSMGYSALDELDERRKKFYGD